MIVNGNSNPFDHLLKHFPEAVQLNASHESIDEYICKLKGKSLMCNFVNSVCMKNKPIKWGFKFSFCCGLKQDIFTSLTCTWERKGTLSWGNLVESVVLSLCESLNSADCYVYFDNFFTSPTLIAKLFENGIYGIGIMGEQTTNICHLWNQRTKQSVVSMIGRHVQLYYIMDGQLICHLSI